MVAVIDYGVGNLRSVANALEAAGADVRVTASSDEVAAASHIVLPGVGAFGACVDGLRATGLVEILDQAVRSRGVPFLGICVGMQLLADESEEGGVVKGLGWIGGRVRRFTDSASLRVPHMGWNDVAPAWRRRRCFAAIPYLGLFLRAQLLSAGRAAGARSPAAATMASSSPRRWCATTSGPRSSTPRRASRTACGFSRIFWISKLLKVRLIPTLLLKNGRMVKGRQFTEFRDVGHPVTTAKVYDAQGADELLFLDITASRDERGILFDVIQRTASACFMPLTVGGGVRTADDIRQLLLAGADKVSINTEAVRRPEFVREAARRFGSQCITVSIDVRGSDPGEVWTHSGTERSGRQPVEWAREAAALGAGEIIVQSIDREGTRAGYDLALTRAVSDAVTVPVVASGGVGRLEDLVDGVTTGGASAVSAGSIFHFTDQSVIKARAFMTHAGLAMRIP